MAMIERRGSVGSGDLHELNAVAEWIEYVRAAIVGDWCVGAGRESGTFARCDDFVEIIDGECGMCAPRCVKIRVGFNAEMQIHWAGDEPDAVASGHRCGLGLFGETKNADVERASGVFAAGGDGDLHVIEAKDWHRVLPLEVVHRLPRARHRSSCRAALRRET